MKIKLLFITLFICLLSQFSYCEDISTNSIISTNSEIQNNDNLNVFETTNAFVSFIEEDYKDFTLRDLIAEEIIELNDTKYDYSSFIMIINIDKTANFIINDGEIIINYETPLNYINQYITPNDFILFSNYSKKSNSIKVKVIKDNNTTGTLSLTDLNNNTIYTKDFNSFNNIVSEEKNDDELLIKKDINISTISNMSISTNSNTNYDVLKIKKIKGAELVETKNFGTDEYGNIIENDPNDWVGEDSGNLNEETEQHNIDNISDNVDKENSGILNVNIDDSFNVKNSNLKIVLVDNTYSLYNLFIYYRNDYKEKLYLPLGKYRINEIVNLNSNVQDLKTNIEEFNITKDNMVELIISQKEKQEEIEVIEEIASKSTISQIEEPKKESLNIVSILFIIAFLVGIGLGIKYFVQKILFQPKEYD